MLLKAHRIDDPSNPQPENQDSGVKSGGFIILRYLPKSIGSLFGAEESDGSSSVDESTNDENSASKILGGADDVDHKRIHLFGGDDDVDKTRIHIFGGGDNDPDKKRFNLLGGGDDPDRLRLDENNKGIFTGGNEDFNQNPVVEQHR